MTQIFKFQELSHTVDWPLWATGSDYRDGDSEPYHNHDFYELVLVRGGSGKHIFDGEQFPIRAGNVFLVAPWQFHGYQGIDSLHICNILFYPQILENHLEDLNAIPGFQLLFHIAPGMEIERRRTGNLRVGEETLAAAMELVNVMSQEQNRRAAGYRSAMAAAFLNLVLLLSRNCEPGDGKYYLHAERISRVIGYMEKNYREEITLAKLTRLAGMSGSSFRRHFQEATGESPIAYLLALRLRKAARLLSSQRLPVGETALRCGFNDSNYFSHQFRRLFGVSPSEYSGNGAARPPENKKPEQA